MIFSNTVSDIKLGDDEYVEILKRAKQKMSCPPWEYKEEEQSITLWTLAQYFERIKTITGNKNIERVKKIFGENNDWIQLDVKNNIFELGLKILGRKDQNEN